MAPITPILIIFTGIVAAAISYLSMTGVSLLAIRCGFVDRPDSQRKLHDRPVALGGGVGIWLAIWVSMCLMAVCEMSLGDLFAEQSWSLLGVFLASFLIVLLGLLDDLFQLRGRHKLIGQIAIASLLINFGYQVRAVNLFGVQIELGLLSVPITLGWLLLAVNSLNLIDGIDGLASTIGLILSTTLACLAFLNGHFVEALLLSMMGGALAGFLPFNFPPARMYLGDAGSMFIGLWLGAISIRASLKGPTLTGLAAPLAAWSIPLLDTFAAIVRRKLTGRSIYTTDRGHLHHCLQQIAGSTRRTLYFIVLACLATCLGALTSVSMKSDVFAVISVISVIGVLVATRSFGYGELQLLSGKLRALAHSLIPGRDREKISPQQQEVRLQGSRPWERLWDSLLDFTEPFNLTRMRLDVDIPVCQEYYHVSWTKAEDTDLQPQWEIKIPLGNGNRPLGRLSIGGFHNGDSASALLAKLFSALPAFETQFQEVIMLGAVDPVGDSSSGDARNDEPRSAGKQLEEVRRLPPIMQVTQ